MTRTRQARSLSILTILTVVARRTNARVRVGGGVVHAHARVARIAGAIVDFSRAIRARPASVAKTRVGVAVREALSVEARVVGT